MVESKTISVNRKIFAGMLAVWAPSVLADLAAAAKEILLARQFGTTDALDAFLIAYLIPSLVINVLVGSFLPAFVPAYVEARERGGEEEARKLFGNVIILGTLLLIACSVFIALFSPYLLPLFASGFAPEKLALTERIFFRLLPVLPLSGICGIWIAGLNAEKEFALASLAPAAIPGATLFALLFFAGPLGIYSLVAGVLIGYLVQAAFLAWRVRLKRLPVLPRWSPECPGLRNAVSQYWPAVAGALIMGSAAVIDQSMAAMLKPGSVSALNYGNKVVAALLTSASMAVATAVLPYFSGMVSAGDWHGIRHSLKTYTRLLFLIGTPAAALLVCFSRVIVRIAFQRGAFTAADADIVSHVQILLSLEIPFYLAGRLFIQMIASLRINSVLTWLGIVNVCVNVVLNYLFMRKWGVAGIALSTSVVYAVSLSIASSIVYRKLAERERAAESCAPSR